MLIGFTTSVELESSVVSFPPFFPPPSTPSAPSPPQREHVAAPLRGSHGGLCLPSSHPRHWRGTESVLRERVGVGVDALYVDRVAFVDGEPAVGGILTGTFTPELLQTCKEQGEGSEGTRIFISCVDRGTL